MCLVWVQEHKANTPPPVVICIICAGSCFTGSELLGGKCQIIKLFNSSLSLYSWLVIKQHSINVRRERQWMTLSRWDGLNPCKLLGSTDWQLMFSPPATDETCWNDFESSNFPTILTLELSLFLVQGWYCSDCVDDAPIINVIIKIISCSVKSRSLIDSSTSSSYSFSSDRSSTRDPTKWVCVMSKCYSCSFLSWTHCTN